MPGGAHVRALEIPEPGPRRGRAAAGRARVASRTRDWLIVSTVPAGAYAEAALERGLQQMDWVAPRALAHESVVEHFLKAPAVLPMQLFTLFTGDDRALEHVVRDRRRIRPILARIEGKLEWGLRLTWNPDLPELGTVADLTLRRATQKKRTERPVSGAAYLARKREQRDAAQARLDEARAHATKLYKAVSREAAAARRRTATEGAAPGSRLVLDAAFLVPARRTSAFRSLVARFVRPVEKAGLTVSLTGPWPAYNFV